MNTTGGLVRNVNARCFLPLQRSRSQAASGSQETGQVIPTSLNSRRPCLAKAGVILHDHRAFTLHVKYKLRTKHFHLSSLQREISTNSITNLIHLVPQQIRNAFPSESERLPTVRTKWLSNYLSNRSRAIYFWWHQPSRDPPIKALFNQRSGDHFRPQDTWGSSKGNLKLLRV